MQMPHVPNPIGDSVNQRSCFVRFGAGEYVFITAFFFEGHQYRTKPYPGFGTVGLWKKTAYRQSKTEISERVRFHWNWLGDWEKVKPVFVAGDYRRIYPEV